tara:strand:+ start:422 stop:1492 length:1071 start_codon:yes stop_codon:yes gene_type:complete
MPELNEHVTWFDEETLASMNASIQVGDTSYFVTTSASGQFNIADKSNLKQLGRIKDVSLIDITGYDPGYDPTTGTSTTGLIYANEAYISFKGDSYGCNPSGNPCLDTGIIRISKSYKEAGIIPGMSIDLGVAPAVDSTGTLTEFSNSIWAKQATAGIDVLYVKSVNPNGDDPNEIEIAQYKYAETHPTFTYQDGEAADITPFDNTEVSTKGMSGLTSLIYTTVSVPGTIGNGEPYYQLANEFQSRPTRVRFSFDNTPSTPSTGTGVYPSTGAAIPEGTNIGYLSPWYGKTKFWMIVTEIEQGYPAANVGDFQMFSKENIVNMSSPKGYYAKARIENNSKIKSEMFAVSVDGYESSK